MPTSYSLSDSAHRRSQKAKKARGSLRAEVNLVRAANMPARSTSTNKRKAPLGHA